MQSYEAEMLLNPPVGLVRLARNSGNMGRISLHTLLAFLLGRMTPDEDLPKLRHIMMRSSQSQVRGAAEELGIPYEVVSENSLATLGVEAGFHRDQ